MLTMIELSQAGLNYPEMQMLQALAAKLRAQRDVSVGIYGGFLRDLLLLGTVFALSDIDMAMSNADYLDLKPKEPDADDLRDDFMLHPPHLKFMQHQVKNGLFEANPRPFVLSLKPEAWGKWGVTRSVGLSLTRGPLDLFSLVEDADLGFAQAVSDGQRIWVSEAFLRDRELRAMTLLRCENARDFARTTLRVQRFQAERYAGWNFVIPQRFAGLQEATA